MKKKLALQWFIEQHLDWEKILSEKPYSITISRDKLAGRNLIMFKYSQIDSDFHLEVVRECRGLILDEDTLEVVCHPFNKFGNFSESYVPEINWKNCHCTQKLDGSLIKVVRLSDSCDKDDLIISTNGTIDAFKAPLAEQIGCTAKSFGELAGEALDNDGITTWAELGQLLKKNYTYMFELTSPFNKVVVTWHDTKLNYLGCRDNASGQEYLFNEDLVLSKIFNTPKVYDLSSVDACIAAAKELGVDEEGYVVVDDKFNRVKIKSPTYVSLHHMRNNGVLSYARGIEIVRGNELDEVLTYFPEFKEHLEKIQKDYNSYIERFKRCEIELNEWIKSNGYVQRYWLIGAGGKNRKDLAKFVMTNLKEFSGFCFAFVDKKIESAKKWIELIPSEKLVIVLGYKDK